MKSDENSNGSSKDRKRSASPLHDDQSSSKVNEEWEQCSLASLDSQAEEEEGPLPIPGRESHTSDLESFDRFLERIRNFERAPTEQPFNGEFWCFFRGLLDAAQPIGYQGLDDPSLVQDKSVEDNERFLQKMGNIALINPVHPVLLAQESGMAQEIVLQELLYGTKAGLLTMKLTPNCLRCGSEACVLNRSQIHRLPRTAYCEGCNYRSNIDCLQKIKVIFTLHMDVFYALAENFACQPSKRALSATRVFAPVPATFSGSGFRYSVGCGKGSLGPALKKGRYRMRCPVSKTDNYLSIENDAKDSDNPIPVPVHVSDLTCREGGPRKTLKAAHGKVKFEVFTNTKSFFVLWIKDDLDDDTLKFLPMDERKPYTNIQDLLKHQTYQLLFGSSTASVLSSAVKRMRAPPAPATGNPKKKQRTRPSGAA